MRFFTPGLERTDRTAQQHSFVRSWQYRLQMAVINRVEEVENRRQKPTTDSLQRR